MAILRKSKRDNYTVIDNSVFKDSELSLKAKGLLCLMLSLPDGWGFSIEGLTALSKDGKAAVMTTLNELEENGYLGRRQIKESGRYAGVEYIVSETKMIDFPYAENQNTEIQHSEKPTLLNTKELNTKELNTNKSNNKRFIPPTTEEVQAYIDERGSSVDAEAFIDYYASQKWKKANGRPVEDWKACVRTWERNGYDTRRSNSERSKLSETDGRSKREAQGNRYKPLPLAADVFAPERSEDDA